MLARYSSDNVVLRELLQNADDAKATEVQFQFATEASRVVELREVNNGAVFSETDWERVARIAEGNPSEDSVGMFGVGFYSVFSLTESPLIASGHECLAFQWAGCKLTTFRSRLPAGERVAFKPLPASAGVSGVPAPATTAVMLPMREARLWDWDALPLFFARAMAFISHVARVTVTRDGDVLFVVDRTTAPGPAPPKGRAGEH